MRAGAAIDLVEKVDGALLEDAGPDPRQDVFAAPRLKDDRVDAGAVEQLSEEQTGRTRTDDGDLGAQRLSPSRARQPAAQAAIRLSIPFQIASIGMIRVLLTRVYCSSPVAGVKT